MNINIPFTSSDEYRLLETTMIGQLKYTLTNDFLVKYAFQNDLFALRGLLAALMSVPIENITDITILNPVEPAHVMGEKTCVLDIKLELNNIYIINIEIQNLFQEFWPERSITYLCRIFDQLNSGENYHMIKPCIQIGIMRNSLFKENDPRYTDEFYAEYRIQNVKTYQEYSSKFLIRVLSLKNLENASEQDKQNPNGLYHWAKLFLATSWEELIMIANTNPSMQSFIGTIKKLSADEKVAQACENRRRYSNEMATYDYMIRTAEEKLTTAEEKLTTAEEKLTTAEEKLTTTEEKLTTAEALIAEKDKLIAELTAKLEKA